MGTSAKARLTRPVFALSSFQHQLIRTVSFSKLDPIELSTYRDYMVGRELVRVEAAVRRSGGPDRANDYVHGILKHPASPKEPMEFGLMPRTRILRAEDWLVSRVELIRTAYHLDKAFVARIPGNPLWFLYPSTRVLCLWPEWPCTPYFDIPADERLRRIKIFTERSKTDRLSERAYLLNPHNPSTIKKDTIEIAVLAKESASGQEQLDAFKAELEIYAPELFKRRPTKSTYGKKQGRASEKARILDDLNSYAAHALRVVAKIPPAKVIDLIRYPTGHKSAGLPVYRSPTKLANSARRFSKHRLPEFWTDLMAHLVPLGS